MIGTVEASPELRFPRPSRRYIHFNPFREGGIPVFVALAPVEANAFLAFARHALLAQRLFEQNRRREQHK
ncbi:hypothetical protein [Bradyrhizobium commune]|uniref:Uncharacterized protein n=1 Tax=Bradyrhizobium commune TaxID=83627 RepID=A0A7S9GXW9_9BRAD|nr:hypothetical protein [Bradyrhizobium commune]QPF89005.1 hypothetical protein IC761_21060 [Bradyrhizobium commune]